MKSVVVSTFISGRFPVDLLAASLLCSFAVMFIQIHVSLINSVTMSCLQVHDIVRRAWSSKNVGRAGRPRGRLAAGGVSGKCARGPGFARLQCVTSIWGYAGAVSTRVAAGGGCCQARTYMYRYL